MRFLDDLIVGVATRLIRGVFAIGTAWVYVQAIGLVLLLGAGVVVLGGMLLRAAAAGIGG
ncbi:hypothetical protein [Aminobacter sp. MSH1]|uniref:hypothetical protein n=1 Tax=Aminobacter sp. MSH1 TaxID=374606 RepID=UPI000D3D4BB8|nr:hypothetical protein [Aminobacter sp. MSH1]